MTAAGAITLLTGTQTGHYNEKPYSSKLEQGFSYFLNRESCW
jgi:hypothetical protein